jgi:uncharacterized coiled-coil DUF342 family protein
MTSSIFDEPLKRQQRRDEFQRVLVEREELIEALSKAWDQINQRDEEIKRQAEEIKRLRAERTALWGDLSDPKEEKEK